MLFIGTQFSNLFTAVDTPARGRVKRLDTQLCLWVNTGTINVSVADPDTAATSYCLTPANNTFSNTCPII